MIEEELVERRKQTNIEAIEEISTNNVKEKKENKAIPTCPCCGSKNVFGISRVVGYYSKIENWNKSKQAELKQRQKGNYWPKEQKDKSKK